jgi:hypothetical protein
MAERRPWDRQKGESKQAFEAFEIYLGLGPLDRSLREAGLELGKSTTLMSRWSARWRWVERCEAWDRERELEEERATLQALQEKAREVEELLRGASPPPASPEPKSSLDEMDPEELSGGELLDYLRKLWEQEARKERRRRA